MEMQKNLGVIRNAKRHQEGVHYKTKILTRRFLQLLPRKILINPVRNHSGYGKILDMKE
jgi:hypothetical protein